MEYVIPASDLYQKAKEILNDGMEYVEISLMEPDDFDPDDPIPAAVHFNAYGKKSLGGDMDYGSIDVVNTDSKMS